MQIPTDYRLDKDTFEDVLDLEGALRLALASPQTSTSPAMEDIRGAWKILDGKLPGTLRAHLAGEIAQLLAAFDQCDQAVIQAIQGKIAAELATLRTDAA